MHENLAKSQAESVTPSRVESLEGIEKKRLEQTPCESVDGRAGRFEPFECGQRAVGFPSRLFPSIANRFSPNNSAPMASIAMNFFSACRARRDGFFGHKHDPTN
jgi:hypothetical protein